MRLVAAMVLAAQALFALSMLWSAGSDAFHYRIPNPAVLAALAAFLLKAGAMEPSAALAHAAVGFAVLAAGLLLWLPGWFGGGDVKLAAAAALWAGPEHLLVFLLIMSLVSSVLSATLLILRRAGLPVAASGKLPYAIAIAPAALWVI